MLTIDNRTLGHRTLRLIATLLGFAAVSALGPGGGTGHAATGAGAFDICPGTHDLLAVTDLQNVSVATACGVWSTTDGGHSLVRCHGRPLTQGSYPVVIKKLYRGWHVFEGKVSPLRFSRGDQSFEGSGQDTPPYPC